jgi:hypothetical protein
MSNVKHGRDVKPFISHSREVSKDRNQTTNKLLEYEN